MLYCVCVDVILRCSCDRIRLEINTYVSVTKPTTISYSLNTIQIWIPVGGALSVLLVAGPGPGRARILTKRTQSLLSEPHGPHGGCDRLGQIHVRSSAGIYQSVHTVQCGQSIRGGQLSLPANKGIRVSERFVSFVKCLSVTHIHHNVKS